MCSWFMFHGQPGLNQSRPKTRLERLTSVNGCLVVFLGCFINPVTSNNRKEKNPKRLGDPMNLIPLCSWPQPFPHASITSAMPRAGLWVHLPLLALEQLPPRAWKLLELQFRGCWLMPVSPPTSVCHSHSNIASLLSRQETWAKGNTEDPCGSVSRSPVCVKFANNSPREDSRVFSLLWGLVWRFSWENWPLSPPPVWCPLSLRDFSSILHGVRRYFLPIRWICWNVPGRTAELVFFAWQELSQSGWPGVAHRCQGMSLEEEIWLLRGLCSQLKRGQRVIPLKNPQIYFFSWGLHFFPPFLRLACSLLCLVRGLGFEKGHLALWGPLWLSKLQGFKV